MRTPSHGLKAMSWFRCAERIPRTGACGTARASQATAARRGR
jgi:hypothetical protein